MKAYINIFISLVMPVSIIFTIVAVIYFSTSFEFNKAFRLGILAGFLSSVAFSFLIALIILIVRFIRRYKFTTSIKPKLHENIDAPILHDPTIYQKKNQTIDYEHLNLSKKNTYAIVETFMLLMDIDLAYEVSLKAISNNDMADAFNEDKQKKTIQLRAGEEEINIKISSLTKHTSQVLISSTINKDNIKKIITILKEKEHSFMQY